MPQEVRLGDLAARVGGRVAGDPGRPIRGVATLDRAGPLDLAFFTNPRYRKNVEGTRAGAILVGPGTVLAGRDLLEAPQPYVALAEILELFHPPSPRRPGISPDARIASGARVGEAAEIGPFTVVEEGAVLGDRVSIGVGCVVGEGVEIGSDTALRPRVVLYPRTRVGRRCLIHSGAVLGADGFGFATTAEGHRKVPQLGRVIVEDDVEIGANTTIDRGTLEDTVIGGGTKIDDLVMVAHGVRIGRHGLLAGQAGIAGSTVLGEHVTFAGQAGASGHLVLGDRVVVAAKSAVFDDLAPGVFAAGVPAVDHRIWKRAQVLIRKLPELRAELRALRERLDALETRDRGEGGA